MVGLTGFEIWTHACGTRSNADVTRRYTRASQARVGRLGQFAALLVPRMFHG